MKNARWTLSAISLLLLTSACTPKPPDVPVCEALTERLSVDPTTQHLILTPSPTCMKRIGEMECGHCVYIMSGREMFLGEKPGAWLNGKPWSAIKSQAIMLPAVESYAPLATYVINACKKMHCSDDVERFKVKVNALEGAASVNLTDSPTGDQNPHD